MRFYNRQHKFYCGIDLHIRKMYVCILDQNGKTKVHQNLKTDPELLFDIIFPFLVNVVICVECMFSWYWVAVFCAEHKIPFVLGHALYMKAIHGGKTKNDKIDSYKIAKLLRGGTLPMAYPYPAKMRATRDLAVPALLYGTSMQSAAGSYPEHQHNKGKALGIYTHKLGRAIYFMLKNKRAFDKKHFFSH